MKYSTFISVIVPIYNAESFLDKCIQSVLQQSFIHFELLLINDGSNDRSGDICEHYAQKDTRIKVIHQPNGGVSKARNKGLEIANSEWVTFIDADDWIEKDTLQTYINHLKPEIDMIIMGYNFVTQTNKIISYTSSNYLETSNKAQVLIKMENSHYYGFLWNRIFKKEILEKNHLRFQEDLTWCEDHLFTHQYLTSTNSKTIFLPDHKYNHTIELSESLSFRYNHPSKILKEAILERETDLIILNEYPHEELESIINSTFRSRIDVALCSLKHKNCHLTIYEKKDIFQYAGKLLKTNSYLFFFNQRIKDIIMRIGTFFKTK
ncbi:glycosyltransferase family 2 protein [Parabacteroides chongii]|uniref:glycosyltransferase family 2 protein n=1 Tax=Parabacteroides chongii TaxID=2685834 RepID=UPI00240E5A5B|nr:glycosyltransferase family 2 protein [Parabacteroides chongii]WFE83091.1 glycosyltransferase family 2 protein [Parabacteroides chongii]